MRACDNIFILKIIHTL